MPRKKEDSQAAGSSPADGSAKDFLKRRITELKDARRSARSHGGRSVEDVWRDADAEFVPHELFPSAGRTRFEADDERGLRSRLVRLGDDEGWQSNVSSSDFYVKVSTAVSILTDMNPEAVFRPAAKKYASLTPLAYACWKHSWEYSDARQQMKKYTFNLAKYGFAVGKTHPRIVMMDKRDFSDPKAPPVKVVKYNDLARTSLNPWTVWISPQARLGDALSVNDWYHEVEYDEDTFAQDFPVDQFPAAKDVKPGMFLEPEQGTGNAPSGDGASASAKKITVGFYENQVRDTYCIWVPSSEIVLHESPLPNKDGMLSLWFSPWTIRDDRSIYGIGIYEIIRNDKMLYDRLSNMTMDQLTLSIYKMFFYKGAEEIGENGRLVTAPGAGYQVLDPSSVQFVNVPGPGEDAWRGMAWMKSLVDENSGVPIQLSGKFVGRTLGQDMQAKETALERLRAPLDFICDALQQEAYLSLSWLEQIYSTPEVLKFTDIKDLESALGELGMDPKDVQAYVSEMSEPKTNGEIMYRLPDDEPGEDGTVAPASFGANVYREVPLKVGLDADGNLYETNEERFFRFGVDLPTGKLDWKGIITIKPQSVLIPSKELTKRNDLDLFNLTFPAIQAMAASPQLVPVLLPPIRQIIRAYDKTPGEWLDEGYFQDLYKQAMQPKDSAQDVKVSLSIALKDMLPQLTEAQKETMEKYLGIKVEEPLFVNPQQMMSQQGAKANQNQSGVNPQEGEKSSGSTRSGSYGISPVADMKRAPTTLGGAVEGSVNMV